MSEQSSDEDRDEENLKNDFRDQMVRNVPFINVIF